VAGCCLRVQGLVSGVSCGWLRYAVSFITDLSGYNVWVVEICGFVWNG
jgi:hypothetical protein